MEGINGAGCCRRETSSPQVKPSVMFPFACRASCRQSRQSSKSLNTERPSPLACVTLMLSDCRQVSEDPIIDNNNYFSDPKSHSSSVSVGEICNSMLYLFAETGHQTSFLRWLCHSMKDVDSSLYISVSAAHFSTSSLTLGTSQRNANCFNPSSCLKPRNAIPGD